MNKLIFEQALIIPAIGGESGVVSANVIDNLLSDSQVDALSANQGRVLRLMYESLRDRVSPILDSNGKVIETVSEYLLRIPMNLRFVGLTVVLKGGDRYEFKDGIQDSDFVKLEMPVVGGGGGGESNIKVIDNLSSTSRIDALSANMGRELQESKASNNDLSRHVSDKNNPHGVTTAQIGAAESVHTHIIDDISNLQLSLDSKLNKTIWDSIFELVEGGIRVKGNLLANGDVVAYTRTGIEGGGGAGGGLISKVYSESELAKEILVESLTETFSAKAIKSIYDRAVTNTQNITNHESSRENPHGVTYQQVGAAAASHSHTISNVEGLQSALDNKANSSDLSSHTGDKKNPHGVTTDQIGAATSSDLNAHKGNANNPHSVTATQVGAPTLSEYNSHKGNTSNPHNVTKTQVGLGSVDNTSDLNKPISNATQAALDKKLDKSIWDGIFELVEGGIKIKGNLLANGDVVAFSKVGIEGGGSGSGGLITRVYGLANLGADVGVESLTETFSAKAIQDIYNRTVSVSTDLLNHKGDRNNPHGVTPSQIGASPSGHTHSILYADDDRTIKPNTTGINTAKAIRPFFTRMDTFGISSGTYGDCLVLDTYSDGSGGYINALITPKGSDRPRLFIARGGWNSDSWLDKAEVWTNLNFDPATKANRNGDLSQDFNANTLSASRITLSLNSVTTTIESGNTSYTHYRSTATAGHWFNKSVYVDGEIYAGTGYGNRVWHNGISGTTAFDWSAKNLILNGVVQGCLSVTSNTTNGYFIGNAANGIGGSNTGGLFYAYGNNPLHFYTNGVSRIHIRGDGFVGIGTVSPLEKLHINGNLRVDKSARDTIIYNTSANGGSLFNLFDSTRGSASGFLVGMNESGNGAIWHRGNQPILFATNGTGRMSINANGSVSIAGDEDGGRFTVHGRGVFTYEENSAGLHCGLRIKNTGWIGNMNTGLEFWNGKNKTVATSRIDDVMVKDGTSGGTLRFFTQPESSINPNNSGLVERMRITDYGAIGIGITTGISATLHTVGTSGRWTGIFKNPSTTGGTSYGILIDAGASAGDSALRIRNAATNSEYFHVRGDGNIGVGTVYANYKLTIGDSDSGFHWHSDGLLSAYANGVQLFNWNSQRVYFNNLIQSNSSAEFRGNITAGSQGENNYCFFKPATAGFSWGNGNGALTIDVRDNASQTPLIISRREGTDGTGANRMFFIEQLNDGNWVYMGLKGSTIFRMNATGSLYIDRDVNSNSSFISTNGFLSTGQYRGANTTNNTHAPFRLDQQLVSAGEFVPILKSVTAMAGRGYWQNALFGIKRMGDDFGSFQMLLAKNDNGTDFSTFDFHSNGSFTMNGNATIGGSRVVIGGGSYGTSSNPLWYQLAFRGYYGGDYALIRSIEMSGTSAEGKLEFLVRGAVGGVSSTPNLVLSLDAAKNARFEANVYAKGEIVAYSTSDKRFKKNVKKLEGCTDFIEKLNPVSYYWNRRAKKLMPHKSNDIDFGLIAQELENVCPEMVHTVFDKYKSIDYVKLIPFLIGSIQELNKKIKDLCQCQMES